MKTIKFRKWGKYTDGSFRMVDWTILNASNAVDFRLDDGESFMQFTGLLDCNGKEIYEGDIVRRNIYTVSSGKTEMSKPYEIIWEDKKAGFEYKVDGYQAGLFYEVHEIIGNIYENPELLK